MSTDQRFLNQQITEDGTNVSAHACFLIAILLVTVQYRCQQHISLWQILIAGAALLAVSTSSPVHRIVC